MELREKIEAAISSLPTGDWKPWHFEAFRVLSKASYDVRHGRYDIAQHRLQTALDILNSR